MLSRAWADGSLTRDETLQVIKTFNRAAGDRRMKQGDYKGEKAALMDEAAYDAGTDADKDRMLHEAVAEFLEANMMRTRKQSAEKSGMINGGTVNKNIKATTRLFLSYLPKPLRTKWEAIMHAVRGVVGMSAMRGVIMKKGIRDGTLKEADIQAFLDKLTGRDLQAEHDAAAVAARDEMVGDLVIDDDAPFSLTRQVMPTDYPATAHKVIATTNVATLTKIFLQPGEKLVPLDKSKENPMMVSPAYKAAKRGGDKQSAWEIAKHFTSGKRIEEYKRVLAGKKPVFVAVRQRESEKMNLLPIAAAWAIQKGIGFGRVAGDVWQIKQGGNTGVTADERGNKEHSFEGVLKLEPDETVVLVDDTFTSGSTLTALFDYLHGQGVTPEHVFTLASGRYTKDLAASHEKQKAALDKIGVDAAGFERATGTPINAFTGAELHGYTLNGKPGIAGFLARFDSKGISGSGRVLRGADLGLSGESSQFSLAPSSITPAIDADYLAAVESGDMDTAQRMVDEAAKAAGYDSPKVYHGTQAQFDTFDFSRVQQNFPGRGHDNGMYFTTNLKQAEWFASYGDERESGIIIPGFVKTQGMAKYPDLAWASGYSADPSIELNGRTTDEWMDRNQEDVTWAKEEGFTGVNLSDLESVGKQGIIVIFQPNQIKSAAPVTYDEDGNVIPLSLRFNASKDSINYSLAPSSYVDSMALNIAARIKDPKAKMSMFTRMLEKIVDLKRDRDEIGVAFGKNFTRKAIEDPRKTASIHRERNFREAARRAELEDEAHAKHFGILDNKDLAKLKEQPIHGYLADPTTPLKGRLMSQSAAMSRGKNFFDPDKQGDYDGAGAASRSLFGGSLMPDQAAQELFDAGLIKSPTPDAMWDALASEAKAVGKMKQYMAAAEKDVSKARLQAKEEATAWEWKRLKEEKENYSPRQRLLRALAMLDAIVSVLPVTERGRIGGHTQLAKLSSDEARLKFLNERIAKVDEVIENYLGKEYRARLDKLMERAMPTKLPPQGHPLPHRLTSHACVAQGNYPACLADRLPAGN